MHLCVWGPLFNLPQVPRCIMIYIISLSVHITGQVSIVDHWGLNSEDLIRDLGEAVFNI